MLICFGPNLLPPVEDLLLLCRGIESPWPGRQRDLYRILFTVQFIQNLIPVSHLLQPIKTPEWHWKTSIPLWTSLPGFVTCVVSSTPHFSSPLECNRNPVVTHSLYTARTGGIGPLRSVHSLSSSLIPSTALWRASRYVTCHHYFSSPQCTFWIFTITAKTLVEKDWLCFGHKFGDRCGQTQTVDAREISPIFTQFLDCTRHLIDLLPTTFEFNSRFLMALHDHSRSGRFGTFVGCSEKQRRELKWAVFFSVYSIGGHRHRSL